MSENIDKTHALQNCYDMCDDISDIKKECEAKLPFHLNVITSAARGNLKETGHSKILADMLKHPQIQASFLKHFLNITVNKPMEVYVEFGGTYNHADVFLHDAERCVVIENKVNDAVEQQKQIFRYVNDIAIKQLGFDLNNIYVLYLNSTDRSYPSLQSVTDDNGNDNLIEKMGTRFVIRSFAYDIVEWLQTIYIKGEKYINSGIEQYIDYLQEHFETSDRYKPMNEQINDYINKKLNLDNISDIEQFDTLTQRLDEVYGLEQKIQDIRLKVVFKKLNEFDASMKQDFSDTDNFKYYGVQDNGRYKLVGLGVHKPTGYINVHICYDVNENSFTYGIICPYDLYPTAYERIVESFESFFNNMGIKYKGSGYWPIWQYSDIKNVYSIFKEMVIFALDSDIKLD